MGVQKQTGQNPFFHETSSYHPGRILFFYLIHKHLLRRWPWVEKIIRELQTWGLSLQTDIYFNVGFV
jgi:hypothetical protein